MINPCEPHIAMGLPLRLHPLSRAPDLGAMARNRPPSSQPTAQANMAPQLNPTATMPGRGRINQA